MKSLSLTMLPLILAGFFLPTEDCNIPKPYQVRVSGTHSDGPYVLYKHNRVYAKYIVDINGVKQVHSDSLPQSQKSDMALTVATDEPGRFFQVKIKNRLENEKTDYAGIGKLYILSDIEGNFKSFRDLLLAGGIIDTAYNWTFGTGHLVLTGDFVDRGSMVNEVLWLIYSLEDKARAAGGYVHYILGNHEIMNMNGDLRYVHPKYLESAGLLGEGFTSLYGEDAELGRWLRTKNVMEKINDFLFVHGGISEPVNRMELSTNRLNKLVRPFYADSLMEFKNPNLDTLYSDLGPFWYRGYYNGSNPLEKETIDRTLRQYRLKKIVTGHTVVAEKISFLYDGKVINTDVHHLGGHSEALLVKEGRYFRVLPSGEVVEVQL
ncbi:MAG: metallophosphoesterase [Chitinophagaceae bacterium]